MATGDEYATELGRLSIAFAQADYYLHGIAIHLVNPDDLKVGMRVCDGMPTQRLSSLVRDLINQRREVDDRVAGLADQLLEVVEKVNAMRIIRNQCLHSIWMAIPGQETATLLSSKRVVDMSFAELQARVDAAEQTGHVVARVWEQLAHAYGAFDALIEATRAMDPTWDDVVEGDGGIPLPVSGSSATDRA